MLAFFNNHLGSGIEVVYDQLLARGYLLIYKNGTRSMMNLVSKNPERFLHIVGVDAKKYLESKTSELTVFIREPIERFLSGLNQQQKNYKFDVDLVLENWERTGSVDLFDTHTVPQFSFLLRAAQLMELKFNIVPLSRLDEIYPDEKKLNVSGPEKISWDRFNPELQERLIFFFTEDIVLYNQFLEKSATINDIISKIAEEKDFAKEYRQYCRVLTYL